MRPRFVSLIGGILSLVGCVNSDAPIKTQAGKLGQGQVDDIVQKCGGVPGMAVVQNGSLIIHRTKDILITGCVLEALQATGETTLPSVGNQKYEVRDNRV
jgi:hypothetical protein